MRVPLDKCLRRLKAHLKGHVISTVLESSCAGTKDREHLARAEATLVVFVTVDRSLVFQQNCPMGTGGPRGASHGSGQPLAPDGCRCQPGGGGPGHVRGRWRG